MKLSGFAELKNLKKAMAFEHPKKSIVDSEIAEVIDSKDSPPNDVEGWGVSCYAGGRPQQGVPQYYTEFAIERDYYEL